MLLKIRTKFAQSFFSQRRPILLISFNLFEQLHNQPVSMSIQNVSFLNVGRVQSGLSQPTFSKALAY